MCCRYFTEMSPELRPYVEEAKSSSIAKRFMADLSRPVMEEGEIFPSMVVPVIATGRSGRKRAFPMKWGYTIPGLKGVVVNARTESAAGKQMFADSWVSHRCIIPASYYYEWEHLLSPNGKKKTGGKYRIRPAGTGLTCLAGLYRMEKGLPVFVVLTKEPEENISFLHDRMPLILPPDLIDDWIDPGKAPELLLPQAEKQMIYEKCG